MLNNDYGFHTVKVEPILICLKPMTRNSNDCFYLNNNINFAILIQITKHQ